MEIIRGFGAAPHSPSRNWPFREMNVGDAIRVPCDAESSKNIRVYAAIRGKKLGMKFSCRMQADGEMLIIRTA